MITQMMYLGLFFTFSVLFPEFEREFGWSRAQISGAHSTMFVVMGIVGVFMGRVNDQVGPRLLLTVSTIVFGLGFALISKIDTVWELYLFYGLLGGLGLAAHDVATLSTVARWYMRGRGLMSGFVKSGAGIGQVTIPLLAAFLIVQFGWRQACLVAGIVAMVVMVIASLLIGYLLAVPDSKERTTVSLVTSMRNPGLALLFAQINAPQMLELKLSILTYLVLTIIFSIPFLNWRKRLAMGT